MLGAPWGGAEEFAPFREPDLFGQVIIGDRAIHDTMASLIVHGVFKRHPNLRVASIENGSDWIYPLIKGLRKQANRTPWIFHEDPLLTIQRHIWVTPYYEEDLRKLADTSACKECCSDRIGRTVKALPILAHLLMNSLRSTMTRNTKSCGPTVRSSSVSRR